MSLQRYDRYITLAITGDIGVGRRTLMRRYAEDQFEERYIQEDIMTKEVHMDNTVMQVTLKTPPKNERFLTSSDSVYREAHGIIIVYDVTDEASFTSVRSWMEEMNVHAREECPFLIVGNKIDLSERLVDKDVAQQTVEQHYEAQYLEVSAKTGSGVDAMFEVLLKKIIARYYTVKPKVPDNVTLISTARSTADEMTGCCCVS